MLVLTYKNLSPPSIGASIVSWPLRAGFQVGCLTSTLSYSALLPQWQGFFSQLLKPSLQHDLLARHFPYEMWLSHPGVNCSDILLEMWQGRGAHSSSSHCFSGRLSSPEADLLLPAGRNRRIVLAIWHPALNILVSQLQAVSWKPNNLCGQHHPLLFFIKNLAQYFKLATDVSQLIGLLGRFAALM